MKRFGATSLFALIVALLVVFTTYDYWSSQKQEASKETAAKVVQLNKDEVVSIEIAGAKEPFKLEKRSGRWQITRPFDESADQQMVLSYLDQMAGEKIAEIVKEGDVDLKPYGLEAPQFTLTLLTPNATRQTIKVGTVKAYDGSLYGQIDDQKKVVLLRSSWDVLMTKPVKEFRDTKLYRGPMKVDFDRILVKARDTNFEINRIDGQYVLKSSSDPIFQESVRTWLEQIKALRGAAFVENPKPGFKPDYSVTLTRTDSEPFVLQVARDSTHPDQFEATSTDLPGGLASRVLVGHSAISSVEIKPDALYSRKAPFDFKADDVRELKFHDAKTGRDLDAKVDPAHPDELISKLGALEAVRFLGSAAGAREKKFPSHLSLLKSDGSVLFEMSWGDVVTEPATADHPEARYLPVKTNLFRQVVGVPEAQIAALAAPEAKKDVR